MSEAMTFDALCEDAVRTFLQSVVVIDNEASLRKDDETSVPRKAVRKGGRLAGPGADESVKTESCADEVAAAVAGEASDDSLWDDKHRLDLNTVSRAFAEHDLTCGVYLPSENDPESSDELVSEAVKAIIPADACVLDWQLRQGSSKESISVVKKVLEFDRKQGGRLRLIIVYTAEELVKAADALREALKSEFEISEQGKDIQVPFISGDHFRIVFLNKPTVQGDVDDPARVAWPNLPERTISEFKTLSVGLLRSFALHSVAAVRRDMHRILAKFDSNLDPVFAADRATKSDPDDAGRLVEEIFLSEIANTLSNADNARRCIKAEGLSTWLEHSEKEKLFRDEEGCQINVAEKEFKALDAEVRRFAVVERDPSSVNHKAAKRIHKNFFKTDEDAEKCTQSFASLATMSRHAFEERDHREIPRLRLGTLIRDSRDRGQKNRIFLCVQPLCDSVRMGKERPFLLVELVKDNNKFHLVLPNGTVPEYLRLPNADERHLESIKFPVSEGADTVVAVSDTGSFPYFVDSSGNRWDWLADLREMHAVRLGKELLTPLGRVGLNSLEWLRTKEP